MTTTQHTPTPATCGRSHPQPFCTCKDCQIAELAAALANVMASFPHMEFPARFVELAKVTP